jgi:hypothetical protein
MRRLGFLIAMLALAACVAPAPSTSPQPVPLPPPRPRVPDYSLPHSAFENVDARVLTVAEFRHEYHGKYVQFEANAYGINQIVARMEDISTHMANLMKDTSAIEVAWSREHRALTKGDVRLATRPYGRQNRPRFQHRRY